MTDQAINIQLIHDVFFLNRNMDLRTLQVLSNRLEESLNASDLFDQVDISVKSKHRDILFNIPDEHKATIASEIPYNVWAVETNARVVEDPAQPLLYDNAKKLMDSSIDALKSFIDSLEPHGLVNIPDGVTVAL